MKNKAMSLLLSFVIAFALWIYVITVVSPDSKVTINNIPVELQGENILNENGLMVVGNETPTIDLRLEGNRSDLNKLNKSNITITVDVTKIDSDGRQSAAYDVRFPGDIPDNAISIQSQYPDTVKLNIEKRISKNIDITAKTEGSLPENYKQKGDPQFDNPTIHITGPESVVNEITQAVAVINLSGKTKTFKTEDLPVELYDADGQKVVFDSSALVRDITKTKATVSVVLTKEITIEKPVVIAGNGASEANTVITYPDKLTISGPENTIKDLESARFVNSIDLGDFDLDQTTQTIKLPLVSLGDDVAIEELPDGIVTENKILYVTVTVSFEKVVTKEIEVSLEYAADWKKMSDDYNIEPTQDVLKVEVRGSSEIVNSLVSDDFSVILDTAVKIDESLTSFDCRIVLVGDHWDENNIVILEYPDKIEVTVTKVPQDLDVEQIGFFSTFSQEQLDEA